MTENKPDISWTSRALWKLGFIKKIIIFDNQDWGLMKLKGVITLFILVHMGIVSHAQQISNQVIVPLGSVVSGNGIFLSQTIGETAVELLTSEWHDLTQGFQQPLVKLLPGTKPQGNGVKVYPNPAFEDINVEFFGDQKGTYTVTVMNLSGTVVYTDNIYFIGDYWQIINIPASGFSKGLYFVRVVSGDGVVNRTFKIDKM